MEIRLSFSPALEALIAKAFDPQSLVRIERKLDQLLKQEQLIMAAIDDLTAEVARDTTVIGAATTLINGFAAQLAKAGTDPAKLKALQDSLKTNTDTLAAAVAANTPAEVA